jgi:lysozyme
LNSDIICANLYLQTQFPKEVRMARYIKGIDVSHWEPEIDWEKVRAQDIHFVFIKATQANFSDGSFAQHWRGSKQAGILRGAYHLIDPRMDAGVQAQTFLQTVTLEPGDFAPILDLEDYLDPVDDTAAGKKGVKGAKPAKGSKGAKANPPRPGTADAPNSKVLACAQSWLTTVERATGRKPILYSSPSYLQSRLVSANGRPPSWSMNYPLWIANYLDHEVGDNDLPIQPPNWSSWTFWQYSKSGFVDGITGDGRPTQVDLDFFSGSVEELYAMAGATMPAGTVGGTPKGDVTTQAGSGTGTSDQGGGASDTGGGTIEVPAGTTTTPPQTNFIKYLIKPGDTLFAIALAHHTTVDAIVKANPQITNPNLIFAGETLNIPQA